MWSIIIRTALPARRSRTGRVIGRVGSSSDPLTLPSEATVKGRAAAITCSRLRADRMSSCCPFCRRNRVTDAIVTL
jgi:hypothetical protein